MIVVKIDSSVATDAGDAVKELQGTHKIERIDVVGKVLSFLKYQFGSKKNTRCPNWLGEQESLAQSRSPTYSQTSRLLPDRTDIKY
jgi:hypothetical protein